MAASKPHREAIQTALDEVELLRAMYPSEDELIVDESTDDVLSRLRQWCENDSVTDPETPSSIGFVLNLEVGEPPGSRRVPLHFDLKLKGDFLLQESILLKLRVGRPDWLTKTETAQLAEGMPEDDILSSIEYIRERAIVQLASEKPEILPPDENSAHIARVWFYFPSISTKSKREEIVEIAPSYGLTGFLLAGKPGVLCLEGETLRIDAYMKYIKTVSWADIMPGHKKVSERFRETGPHLSRVFSDMQEITNLLEKRGERSNRGDMRALEAWLTEKGLAGAFSEVLL